MKLVVVESPTKAKTINKFLGKEYNIVASMGHIVDLPKSKLGVDIENGFKPQYEIVDDKKKIITELKKYAKDASEIILATDPDREGEAIASNIKDVLIEKKNLKNKQQKFSRIAFHEITYEAIEEALRNPRDINSQLVDAQTARRVLDRLVGYKLSPLLWQKVRRGLSAGRVQSVALRLIVEREKEIKAFEKEEYWTITALITKNNKTEETPFDLIEIKRIKIESQKTFKLYDGEYKISKTSIINKEMAKQMENDLRSKIFVVADVLKKESRRSPQMPYTTSTLQQDASRRYGLSGKRTMSLAQKLYEEGFITYHRTDSVNMAVKAVNQIREYVTKQYGEKYIPEKPRFYKTKQKLAQEAHEAIRPTKFNLSVKDITEKLSSQHARIYDLIWKRAVASQMSDVITESTTVYVDAKDQNEVVYRFKTNGSVLLFDGFLRANPFGIQDKKLPQFVALESVNLKKIIAEQHETPPPPRYNDASLIATLEEEGIGRPSTYASIISVIESRQYIEKEQGRFIPTPVGNAVNDFLVQHFSDIDDIPFTAHVEDELDAIASGEKQWIPVIGNFYNPFEKTLEKVKTAERVKIEVEETNEICPQCGGKLVVRIGRFGKFLSCGNFPTCNLKKAYVEDTKIQCPKCKEGKIIVKKTKKGRKFYGCSRYPDCDFAVWKLQAIKP